MHAPSLQLLIVADDLSGAADCAIPCVAAGLKTWVALTDTPTALTADVLALDADTRGLPAAEAAARTAALLRRHGQPGSLWFKKFDSTLRGNIGAELAAMLAVHRDWAPESFALVAPAFPAMGRQTRGGRQYLHNVPVECTDIWQREGLKGRADLADLISQAGLRVASLSLEAIRAGQTSLTAALTAAGLAYDAVVCDAETDADLHAIAQAAAAHARPLLWAGSAGLARALPHATGLARGAPPCLPSPLAHGPILFVVGSMSDISREQIRHLTTAGDVRQLTLPPALLRGGAASAAWQTARNELTAGLAAGQDMVVKLGMDAALNINEGRIFSQMLASLVAPLVPRLSGLVATGGETARAVLTACGINTLRLVGEIEPGVPHAMITDETGNRHGLNLITKAGAFGTPETLSRCRAALRHPTHPHGVI